MAAVGSNMFGWSSGTIHDWIEGCATGGKPTWAGDTHQERHNTEAFADQADLSLSGPAYQAKGGQQSFIEQHSEGVRTLAEDKMAVAALTQMQAPTDHNKHQWRESTNEPHP